MQKQTRKNQGEISILGYFPLRFIFKMAALNTYFLLRKKIILLVLLRRRIMKKKREGKRACHFWVRQLFAECPQKGLFSILAKYLLLQDHLYFFQNFRMSLTTFELLLSWVGPLIKRSS